VSAPTPGPGLIAVVTLGASFSPSSVTLSVGEPLLINVNGDVASMMTGPVTATTPDGPLTGGALGPASYVYFATKPGTEILSATIRPRCEPGTMCPMWIAMSRLTVTVSP
jgi:hypothetical protein